ncbi:MAG: hypothetical protein FWE67_13110 [Planctomycetaceae bacterium]|nr:hypothetical protein [Planctomycetaceae bacterium]
MYETIRSQILSVIAEITANPKPTYSIDGQSIKWNEYLAQLQKSVDWCNENIEKESAPIEIVSTAR